MSSARLDVSLFVYSFRGGGAETNMITIGNELHRRGHDVTIITVDPTGPCTSQIHEGVDVKELGGTHIIGITHHLRKYLQTTNTDVLLSTMEVPNLITIFATRSPLSVPIVLRIASVYSERDRSGKLRFIPFLKRIAYPKANAIITISDGVAVDISDTTGINVKDLTTIYNPVYEPAIPELASEPINHPWFSDETPLVIGVGNMKPAKDFPTLLRAVARSPEVRLVILGRSSGRDDLEHLAGELGIKDRVDFPGFVDNPYAYMAKADVFVLSSAWEGFGNVLVEAMACGTPVVSTDCPGGPSEILDGGEYGPLVPVGDDEAMAKAIKAVLADPIDSSALQSRAKDFAIEPIVDQYEDVLLSVIE